MNENTVTLFITHIHEHFWPYKEKFTTCIAFTKTWRCYIIICIKIGSYQLCVRFWNTRFRFWNKNAHTDVYLSMWQARENRKQNFCFKIFKPLVFIRLGSFVMCDNWEQYPFFRNQLIYAAWWRCWACVCGGEWVLEQNGWLEQVCQIL
jgi:hypothetical protein